MAFYAIAWCDNKDLHGDHMWLPGGDKDEEEITCPGRREPTEPKRNLTPEETQGLREWMSNGPVTQTFEVPMTPENMTRRMSHAGHVAVAVPQIIEGLGAIYGSDADFCSVCGGPVVFPESYGDADEDTFDVTKEALERFAEVMAEVLTGEMTPVDEAVLASELDEVDRSAPGYDPDNPCDHEDAVAFCPDCGLNMSKLWEVVVADEDLTCRAQGDTSCNHEDEGLCGLNCPMGEEPDLDRDDDDCCPPDEKDTCGPFDEAPEGAEGKFRGPQSFHEQLTEVLLRIDNEGRVPNPEHGKHPDSACAELGCDFKVVGKHSGADCPTFGCSACVPEFSQTTVDGKTRWFCTRLDTHWSHMLKGGFVCQGIDPPRSRNVGTDKEFLAEARKEIFRLKDYALCMDGFTFGQMLQGEWCTECGAGRQHAEAMGLLPPASTKCNLPNYHRLGCGCGTPIKQVSQEKVRYVVGLLEHQLRLAEAERLRSVNRSEGERGFWDAVCKDRVYSLGVVRGNLEDKR